MQKLGRLSVTEPPKGEVNTFYKYDTTVLAVAINTPLTPNQSIPRTPAVNNAYEDLIYLQLLLGNPFNNLTTLLDTINQVHCCKQ